MIILQNWIATIPESEKHIAFVGEHQSVTRQFLLTGADWATYKDWGFHLDMAFDLSSVTSRAERKLEKTQVQNTENATETQVNTTGTTTKESYTVTEVEVDCSAQTDVASLSKTVLDDGIQLTWNVLRQHTQLPGKLTATLRALGPDGQVKKSDLMVFEVEPAVVAEPAADLAQSEFEAMEERMDGMLNTVLLNVLDVSLNTQEVRDAAVQVRQNAEQVDKQTQLAQEAADAAKQAEDTALGVQDAMKGAFDRYPSNNLLNLDEVIYGKGMDKSGAMGSLDTYDLSLTGYIPVKEGDVLSYQRTNAETGEREYWGYYLVCLFDEDKNVNMEANNFTASETGGLHEITIPAGVSYVRLTLHDLPSSVDPAIANCSELVPYEPYTGVYRLKKEAYDAEDMQEHLQAVRCVSQELTEQQKAQARENIGALPEDYQPPVDTCLNKESTNPVSNQTITEIYQNTVLPRLLPEVRNEQTYYILRVGTNGLGYEFIPIQQDAYIKQWILPYILPRVTSADNGKTMQVVSGTWQLV